MYRASYYDGLPSCDTAVLSTTSSRCADQVEIDYEESDSINSEATTLVVPSVPSSTLVTESVISTALSTTESVVQSTFKLTPTITPTAWSDLLLVTSTTQSPTAASTASIAQSITSTAQVHPTVGPTEDHTSRSTNSRSSSSIDPWPTMNASSSNDHINMFLYIIIPLSGALMCVITAILTLLCLS